MLTRTPADEVREDLRARWENLPPQIAFMGAHVHPVTMDTLNGLIDAAMAHDTRRIIANHNMHSLASYRSDDKLRSFYERADVIHVDGMALIAIARVLGLPLRREHRTTYVDWIIPLLTLASVRGWRVFYLGSRPGIGEKAAAQLRHQLDGLQIATAHGYFDTTSGGADNQRVIEAINEFSPDLLLVGMGMPRQEHWVLDNIEALSARVVLTCGACMDYQAGIIRTPPRWAGQLGIEWLFRLGYEPARLWRRYLLEPWGLLPLLVDELRSRS